MDQEISQSELENLIAASAPQPVATEGLKLQILREARRQKNRLQSRYQLVGVVASCLLLFVLTEASLHSVGNASQQLASG
ncbi:MAG: hypothetical protein JKY95_02185, partial [Planctomycetaceae bacterium]|nr:hypothetical protein [Planctomycetaceae bacterium]